MPYQRPTEARISDTFVGHLNRTRASVEPGVDYACAYGTILYAPESGRVVAIDTSPNGADGRTITLDLDDGRRVRWLHLSVFLTGVGAQFKRGTALARSGASANGVNWGVGAHVHVTLFPTHQNVFNNGFSRNFKGSLDFELYVGSNTASAESQDVKNRQAWLNRTRGEKLVVDGIFTDILPDGTESKTKAAFKRYQQFLRDQWGYTGAIDGFWGAQTQQAHQRYSDSVLHKSATQPTGNAPATPVYPIAKVSLLGQLPSVRGLQKVARLYGYKGGIDNIWGKNSNMAFQKFLDQNYAGSVAVWLRAKYGYSGDNRWGPNMKAAATRANDANDRAL